MKTTMSEKHFEFESRSMGYNGANGAKMYNMISRTSVRKRCFLVSKESSTG